MKSFLSVSGLVTAAVFIVGLNIVPSAAEAQVVATDLKCKGCVDKKDIGKKQIVSKHIKDGKVKAKHLNADAKPGGAASVIDGAPGAIGTDEIINTIELNAPSDGTAVVSASGYMLFGGGTTITCMITQETTVTGSTNRIRASGLAANVRVPYASVTVFPVTEGPNTFNVVCTATGNISIFDPNLVAMFVPQDYGTASPDPVAEAGADDD